ncbi:MAG: glycine zipper domain-containing protein [Planctomycetota bacterium]
MVKSFTTVLLVISVGLGLALAGGCESEAQSGALLGGAVGAGAGAIVGHQSGKTTEGALIGGAVGAGAGYMIGNEGDKKQADADRAAIREEMNYVTVNITNSNGSITPVRLRKEGVVYIGPKGETYTTLPTPEQLKPVYGF